MGVLSIGRILVEFLGPENPCILHLENTTKMFSPNAVTSLHLVSSIWDTCLYTRYVATVYYHQPLYIITDHPQPIFKVLTSTQSSENHLYFFFCSYVLGTHFLLIYESSLYSKGIILDSILFLQLQSLFEMI